MDVDGQCLARWYEAGAFFHYHDLLRSKSDREPGPANSRGPASRRLQHPGRALRLAGERTQPKHRSILAKPVSGPREPSESQVRVQREFQKSEQSVWFHS